MIIGFISIRRYRDIDRGIGDLVIIAAPTDRTISYTCHVHCSPGTNRVHSNIYAIAHNRPTCSPDKQRRTDIIIWKTVIWLMPPERSPVDGQSATSRRQGGSTPFSTRKEHYNTSFKPSMVTSDAALLVFVLCPLKTVASLGGDGPPQVTPEWNFFVGEFRKNTGQTMSGVATRRPVRNGQQFAEGWRLKKVADFWGKN